MAMERVGGQSLEEYLAALSPGKRLRYLREQRGRDFTQTELARLSGISESHISRLEADQRELSAEVAKELAQHLCADPGWFMNLFGFTYVSASQSEALRAPAAWLHRVELALAESPLSREEQRAAVVLLKRAAS